MKHFFKKMICISLGLFVLGVGQNFSYAMAAYVHYDPIHDPLQKGEKVYTTDEWEHKHYVDHFVTHQYTDYHCCYSRTYFETENDGHGVVNPGEGDNILKTVDFVDKDGTVHLILNNGTRTERNINHVARTRTGIHDCVQGYCIGQSFNANSQSGHVVGIGIGPGTDSGDGWVMVKFPQQTVRCSTGRIRGMF